MGALVSELYQQEDRPGFDNPYDLTPCELQIGLLMRDAVPPQHIATVLNLSAAFVTVTLARILRKTGASNTAHLRHIIATLYRAPREQVYLEDISSRFEAAPLDPYAYQSVVFA